MLMPESGPEDSSFDADSFLSTLSGPSSHIQDDAPLADEEPGADTAPPQTPETSGSQAPATSAPKTPEPFQGLEFDAAGKRVQVPFADPRVKQWVAQGYDYAQRMAAFKQEQQAWEAQRQGYSKYAEIDQFVKSDPRGKDWLEHVNRAWEQREQLLANGQLDPVKATVEQLVQERLAPFQKDLEARQAAEREAKIQHENEALDQEIKSIRDQFADLDWDAPGQDGLSLELRVLKHANQNGINSFRAAFRDLMADDLVKRAEARGKEAAAKEIQATKRQGLLGQTRAPTKGELQTAADRRGKSLRDLTREGLDELGIQIDGL